MISRDIDISKPASGGATLVDAPGSARVRRPRVSRVYASWGKRLFDVVATVLMAPIWLTFVLVAAALVFASDRKWPFYTQLRLGRDRKVFRMWKLRTMVVDADKRLEAYLAANPEARAEWDATQKLKRDPRITAVGAALRKTSLDEIPQLFNVLSGDMSLVGPRPIMLSQEAMYPGKGYYHLRPGLTGLWQVSARNDCDFVDRVRFDNTYLMSQSLSTDLGVLVRTVGAVTRGTGY